MRILWNEATSGAPALDPLWHMLRGYLARISRSDTELEMRHLPVSGDFARSLYSEHLNNRAIVENTIAAEQDGFDAVVLGCWADPLWEARSEVAIPVIGIGEASMLLALTLGAKFAVVTVAPGVVPTIENDLRLYGLESRAIARPVRSLKPASDGGLLLESVDDPWKSLIPNFERVARACIADGAEVIVVGCGYYGPILTEHGYTEIPGTGVPVLDCSAAGLKLAEAKADLVRSVGLKKSTVLYFKPSPPETLAKVRKIHGLI